MKTTCSVEEIEDELNELKLRVAKMNARRNAQINLLQKNIDDGSLRNKIYSKSDNAFRSSYLGYPLHYYWPFLPPYKYSSWNNLLDIAKLDDFSKKYPKFSSKKDHLDAYKLLEQKVQSDILRKLKRFVLDQEKEITDEFSDRLIYRRKPYSPELYSEKKLDNKNQSDIDLKLNSDDRQSPFLKPFNKNDNFYKRYNSFMKRILKPLRKISPPSKFNDYKSTPISTKTTNWNYNKPLSCTSKYFPPSIVKPTTPIKTPLNNLNVSYLRPWQKYSPIHRDYFADYEYPSKNYRVPRDVEAIIRDMEFENRRTYPFMSTYPNYRSAYNYPSSSMKYDPHESDTYVRSTLPTWKQYYYTQKLSSKPSHEKFIDYYDPYRDFFCDGASTKSDDMNTSPTRDDFEVNSLISDNCSVLPLGKGYDSMDDLEIIDDYRDSIYEEIIKNLRNQQRKKFKKNNRLSSRSFTPGLLKNNRSLYNYRITEPSLNRSYSWRQPNSYNSIYGTKYNFKNTSELPTVTDDKWKSSNYENSTATPTTEDRFTSSKYNLSSPTKSTLNNQELVDKQGDQLPSNKYTSTLSSSRFNQLDDTSPPVGLSSPNKCPKNPFPIAPSATDDGKYPEAQDKSSVNYNTQNYKSKNETASYLPKSSIGSIGKVENPTRENANSYVTEKDTDLVNPIRRSSTFESKQFTEPSSPIKQTTSSPKRQPLQSNPPSPISHLPESSPPVPAPLSRKNSMQFPARKASVHNSSIEEEPGAFPKTDKSRRYSKDQALYPAEIAHKSIPPGSTNMAKRLSHGGGIKEPINEIKEEKIKPETEYDFYSQRKEVENIPQQRNYSEDNYNRSQQFQPPQNFKTTGISSGPDTNTNLTYQDRPYHETSGHQSNYNRYPETTNPSNYNERYYSNQYDPSADNAYKAYNEYAYHDNKNDYEQYNYPTRYDENVAVAFDAGKIPGRMDSSYVENRAQYKDPSYPIEKRPSNESYQMADLPRATEYEKYPDEDYKPDYYRNSNRNVENRASVHESDNYGGNMYRETSQDENYNNNYLYQEPQLSRPYQDEFRPGPQDGNDNQYVETEPKSFENYSLNSTTERDSNDQSYPYSGQQSYENTNYPSGENFNEPVPDKIQDTPAETIKSVASEQKVKDRKKSSLVELSQESETPVAEPPPKEVSISRRTSKAALTLAEQRKAAAQLADKNKTMKTKLSESKLKRTPSVLKTKPVVKKT